MHGGAILIALCASSTSAALAPPRLPVCATYAISTRDCRRAPHIVGQVIDDDDDEQKRFDRLGREEAALDAAPIGGDGGLAAEFNARLASEGGREVFKIKTGVSEVGSVAKEGMGKVQEAGQNVAGNLPRLNQQQQNIAKIIGGLVLFQVVIQLFAALLSGGNDGGGGYSV
jgi:hypothetical protein